MSTTSSKISEKQADKKRTAGLASVVCLVIGVQFSGMVTGWNGGAAEGIGELVLANLLIGSMYILISMCFAELSSIVPFAGGSFGFCRAALGPFWGFMVGASEMMENFLYVIVTVMSVGSACTEVFGTDRSLEPVWFLIAYLILYGVHLRGGLFFWYTVIASGITTALLVILYCSVNMRSVNVEKFGMPDGLVFKRSPLHFMESVFYPTWFYLGLEIAPQTCERVKDVNTTLPRGMVIATVITFVVSFWMIFAGTCNYPGFGQTLSEAAFPLSYGFRRVLGTPASFGALVSIVPSMSAAVGFMWGCGYQVASLARSGLMPSVLAKSYGENEIPYLAMAISCVLQYCVCIAMWATAPVLGPKTLFLTIVIGASVVYGGIFLAFIVFRTHFETMKRHWVNVAGIPGAVFGFAVAALLFVAATSFRQEVAGTIIYFVYMVIAAVYYWTYARYTQFFSAEEQKKFMKAYVMNANKKNRRKQKSQYQKMYSRMFSMLPKIPGFTKSMSQSAAGSKEVSIQSSQAALSTSELDSQDSEKRVVEYPVVSVKKNSVSPDMPIEKTVPISSDLEMGSVSNGKSDGEVREGEHTQTIHSVGSVSSTSHRHPPARNNTLRASWAISPSMKVGWSGKFMTMDESKKFFELLTSEEANMAEKLAIELPNQFVMVPDDLPSPNVIPGGSVTRGSVNAAFLNQVIPEEFIVESS